MPLLEQFNLAGKKPGLQVWRIEKMDLVPVPAALYGQFYNGDSYIVMYTSSNSNQYNVHAWKGEHILSSALFVCSLAFKCHISILVHVHLCRTGSKSTQDETAAAAIIMTQLDQHLNNVPVQFTERQGTESNYFNSYFKSGIVYKVKQQRPCCYFLTNTQEQLAVSVHVFYSTSFKLL